jgi:hypothetical protein
LPDSSELGDLLTNDSLLQLTQRNNMQGEIIERRLGFIV